MSLLSLSRFPLSLFSASPLGWSSARRLLLANALLAVLWLLVAWAVSLP
ncbi:hypothetical protein [Pokkaliibacter plantistimulans]|nr:hypothetical protein [Pokkaliibacter plantistimulans]